MRGGGSSVTLSDVAAQAGVSLATASRALNGSARQVRPDLAAKVRDAADRLDYRPNAQAQAVARGSTNVIGLLVTDIADPYFSSIASAIGRAAQAGGLLVMLTSTYADLDEERRYVGALRSQRGRAIVLIGSRTLGARSAPLKRELAAFREAGGRAVAISQPVLGVDTVVIDNRSGARDLATALAGRGYRRFAVLAGPEALLTARERTDGFVAGLTAAGVEAPLVVHGDFTRDGGHAAMLELLAAGSEVDCVFAVNDVMAVGAMSAARESGVDVPRDLGLAGFDDIATLRDVHPALTTVRLDLERIGEIAVEMVLDGEGGDGRRRTVRGEVVLRESTPGR